MEIFHFFMFPARGCKYGTNPGNRGANEEKGEEGERGEDTAKLSGMSSKIVIWIEIQLKMQATIAELEANSEIVEDIERMKLSNTDVSGFWIFYDFIFRIVFYQQTKTIINDFI